MRPTELGTSVSLSTLNVLFFFYLHFCFLSFVPGAFCKDQVYLDGALQLLKHRKSIDFHLLIRLGKIDWQDIEKLAPMADLENTRIPFFMKDLQFYHECLDKIVEANALTDDVLEDV